MFTAIRLPSAAAGALIKACRTVFRRRRNLPSDHSHHLCHRAMRHAHSSGHDCVTSTSGGEKGFIHGLWFPHHRHELSAARAKVAVETVIGDATRRPSPEHQTPL